MFSSASKPQNAPNSADRKKRNEPEAPSTPSLRDMISKAVADLRETQGSTAKSIYDFVSTKLVPSYLATPTKINRELEKSVEAGLLVTNRKTKLLINLLNYSCFRTPFLSFQIQQDTWKYPKDSNCSIEQVDSQIRSQV